MKPNPPPFPHLLIYFLLPILLTTPTTTQPPHPWLPKIVWTFWQQPIQTHSTLYYNLLKSFHNNLQAHTTGWQYNHLDRTTMWHYLQHIPDFRQHYYSDAYQNDLPAKRSNLVRFALLREYGGVYFDLTCILTGSVDWVLELGRLEGVRNVGAGEPELFLSYSYQHGYMEEVWDQGTKSKFLLFPTYEIFFMAAKPNCTFLKQWYQFTTKTKIQSWQQKKYRTKSRIVEIAQQQNIIKGNFQPSMQKYFQYQIAAQIIMQRKQRQLDLQHNNTPSLPRPLAVQHYKIWTAPTNILGYNKGNLDIWSYCAQSPIPTLMRTTRFNPYFIKMFHGQPNNIPSKLLSKSFYSPYIHCIKRYYILNNSILYQYLLRDMEGVEGVGKFYENCVVGEGEVGGMVVDTFWVEVAVLVVVGGLLGVGVRAAIRGKFRKDYQSPPTSDHQIQNN